MYKRAICESGAGVYVTLCDSKTRIGRLCGPRGRAIAAICTPGETRWSADVRGARRRAEAQARERLTGNWDAGSAPARHARETRASEHVCEWFEVNAYANKYRSTVREYAVGCGRLR